jgi:hypothetical protein
MPKKSVLALARHGARVVPVALALSDLATPVLDDLLDLVLPGPFATERLGLALCRSPIEEAAAPLELVPPPPVRTFFFATAPSSVRQRFDG